MIEAFAALLMLSLLADRSEAQSNAKALLSELNKPTRMQFYIVIGFEQDEAGALFQGVKADEVRRAIESQLAEIAQVVDAHYSFTPGIRRLLQPDARVQVLRHFHKEEGSSGPIWWGAAVFELSSPRREGREDLEEWFWSVLYGNLELPGVFVVVGSNGREFPFRPVLTEEERTEIESKRLLGVWPEVGVHPYELDPTEDKIVWKDFWVRIAKASGWSYR